jgi:hypothetical protein
MPTPRSVASVFRYNRRVDLDALRRAHQFADAAFTAARDRIYEESDRKLAEVHGKLAVRGLLRSGLMNAEVARIYGERISAFMQARADALLEGYELYAVQIDNAIAKSILNDVTQLRAQTVAAAKGSIQSQNARQGGASFGRHVDRLTAAPLSAIRAQIERRRLNQGKAETIRSSVTNVYHVYGHNPRWNVNSQDHSVNVMTVSSELVFTRQREAIANHIAAGDEQQDILNRLSVLEQAEGSRSFAQRYTEFISAAANHMTLLAPFIPALAEMLHKVLP